MQQLRATNLSPPANIAPSGNNVGGSTSSPPAGSPPMEHRTVYFPNRPSISPTSDAAQQMSFLPNQDRNTPPEPHKASPFSQDSQADEVDHKDERRDERADRGSPPKGPKRLSTGQDPTILEKIWGVLFDYEGQATPTTWTIPPRHFHPFDRRSRASEQLSNHTTEDAELP